jgi:hypothetical protein
VVVDSAMFYHFSGVRSQLRGHVAAVFSAVVSRSSVSRRSRYGFSSCLWMDSHYVRVRGAVVTSSVSVNPFARFL